MAREMYQSASTSTKVITLADWEQNLSEAVISKGDMNKLIMNFLITNTDDFVEAAKKFMMESGTEPDLDFGEASDQVFAQKAVQDGNVLEAIQKVNDMNPEILKTNPKLFFHLQQQRVIELIREGNLEEALEISNKELAPSGEENREELERTLLLLAFDNPSDCPVQDLYSLSHRKKTATELNAAFLKSRRLENDPKLVHVLKLLVWAQNKLFERAIYPYIVDFINATLEDNLLDGE